MSDVIDTDLLCLGCMDSHAGHAFCPSCGWSRNSPTGSHQLPPGTILGGELLIGSVLGEGGFGITYVALDLNLNKKLAVKEYFPRSLAQRGSDGESVSSSRREDTQNFAEGLAKFRNEARTLAALGSERGIVSVLRYLEWNGTGYLVMPFVDGMTFRQFLDQEGGKIDFPRCLSILNPVIETLGRLHQTGLFHRDLSPDNIYLPKDGPALLFDFGAARQATEASAGDLSVIVKVGYAPEEQYRRDGHQGPWTDVYGLAATMYRAITGKPPLGALERLNSDGLATPSSLGAQIEPAAEAVLMRALAVKAPQRISTMSELQTQLAGTAKSSSGSKEYQSSQQSDEKGSIRPGRFPLVPEKLQLPLALALGATLVVGLLGISSVLGLVALWKSTRPASAAAPLAITETQTPSAIPDPIPSPSASAINNAPIETGYGIAFVSKRGKFSVAIPRNSPEVKLTESEYKNSFGKVKSLGSRWFVNDSMYSVTRLDYPEVQMESTTPKELVNDFAVAIQKDQKVEESDSTNVQGLPGVCSKFIQTGDGGVKLYGRSLYLAKGARLYVVVVLGQDETIWNNEDAIRFLETFNVVESNHKAP